MSIIRFLRLSLRKQSDGRDEQKSPLP